MKRWAAVAVLSLTLYSGTFGQTIYNSRDFYKPMTDDYDVKHSGQVFLPPCMKQLLNCWEIVKPELVCRYGREYRIALESICMDLRLQCTEFTGPLPFKTLNISTWTQCTPTKMQLPTVELGPYADASNTDDSWWWWWLSYLPGYNYLTG